MSDDRLAWTCSQLQRLLGFQQVHDIARKLITLANTSEGLVLEYLTEILGESREVQVFTQEFIKRGPPPINAPVNSLQPTDPLLSKGRSLQVSYVPSKSKGKPTSEQFPPSRLECACEGRKHPEYANCLVCGRILCTVEGEGLCFFCGSYVEPHETKPNSAFIDSCHSMATRTNGCLAPVDVYTQDTVSQDDSKQAIAHKNTLLQFAKEKSKRTRIVDEQSEFYVMDDVDSNLWLSDLERELAETKALSVEKSIAKEIHHGSGAYTVTLDLANKSVVMEDNTESLVGKLNEFSDPILEQQPMPQENAADRLRGEAKQVYDDMRKALKSQRDARRIGSTVSTGNVAPVTASTRMCPTKNVCLSMHQPWASLLVAGIKKIEGRSWSSPHRGPLWIAATTRVPTLEEIDEIERQYEELLGPHACEDLFPEEYPTGALVGQVTIENVLHCSEYDPVRYEVSEENSSDYVWLCSQPRKLLVPLKVFNSGHKLWSMDRDLHNMATSGLSLV